MSKRPADDQTGLGNAQAAGDARGIPSATFSAAKTQYILDQIEKPMTLDNGRPRTSTHKRQDSMDTQMHLLFGSKWRLTDSRLENRTKAAADAFDATGPVDTDTDANLIQDIVEAVLRYRFLPTS